MSGGADSDDGFSGVQKASERCELRFWQLAEARADDHQLGIVQHLGAANVLLIVGVDEAFLFVGGEEHHTIEAMGFRQDLSQHGHRFLGAVFLITSHEHDGFPFACADGIGGDF